MLFLSLFGLRVYAQSDSTGRVNLNNTPLTINLYEEEEEEAVGPKIKRKKNEFFGYRTKKGFTKTRIRDKVVVETFRYLKHDQELDPYVRDIYWFSFKDGKIHRSRNFDEKHGVLLHGPYKKFISGTDQTLEEGYFYRGMKHARWMRYNTDNILQDKEKYFKGWPKDSQVTYYDQEEKQVREVIPIEYGEREGNYYYFHENGRIAVMGEFRFDKKVGVWREFYRFSRGRKKEIQYAPEKDPFDQSHQPFIVREWNKKGKLVYQRDE